MAKISTLRDDFEDGVIDPAKWTMDGSNSNVSITEEDGRLVFTTLASNSGGSGLLRSVQTFDLTGSQVVVEAFSATPRKAATELYLVVDSTHWIEILTLHGSLVTRHWGPWGSANHEVGPYDPTLHRWWRIRHDAGANLIHWETSPDGAAWTTHRSEAPGFPITALYAQLGLYVITIQLSPARGWFDNLNLPPTPLRLDASAARSLGPRDVRRIASREIREEAARIAFERPHLSHVDNVEESDYPFVANYSKGLQHDGYTGDVVPASYQSLLQALESGEPVDFEAILLGPGGKKLTNPQAGLAFDLEGPDTHAVTMPPAPRIDSPQNSSEMAELYWMSLARDVHFSDYGSDAVVQQAIQSLNTEFSDFRGPREGGAVTTQTVFRGIYPGETVGPYLSQFLLKGTSDPRLPLGQGRSTTDGLITYGDLKIDQRQVTVVPGVDYLFDFPWWLLAQDGHDFRGQDQVDTSQRRFVRNLRDLGERVHIDNVADMFFNACLILLHEVPGDQIAGSGVIARDMEFPLDQGNPYLGYAKQAPFATLGAPHALTLVWELLTRALRAVWFQKWFVHRRLRPEEFGGRLDNHLTGRRTYPQIDGEILASLQGGLLSQHFPSRYGSYLLPQAFPEGAPTHPAYGAGHATGSGACATILKAFFNESTPIESPLVPDASGTSLGPYTGADAGQMTVGGEINKLAGNVAIGRNAAGVHWRSDYDQSLLLGETVAIGVLQEQSLLLNEPEFYQLTRFDGTTIRIHDGTVSTV